MRNILLSLLILCALAGHAAAQDIPPLSADYRALLTEAAEFEDGTHFEAAVRLVAQAAEGGADSVIAALESEAPERADQARAILGFPVTPETLPARMAEAGIDPEPAPETDAARRGGIIGGIVGVLFSERGDSAWSGRVRAGLRMDEGNTRQQDYTLGLEVQRALIGWGFHAALDYAYSEVTNRGAALARVSRDNFKANARAERELGERWTAFVLGDFERDRLSSYEHTSFLGAGLGFRVIEQPDVNWTLRAAPGVRHQQPVVGASSTGLAGEFNSDIAWEVSPRLSLRSRSNFTAADAARAEQTFSATSRIAGGWGLEARYRYRYDFDPLPDFQSTDKRLDLSLIKEF